MVACAQISLFLELIKKTVYTEGYQPLKLYSLNKITTREATQHAFLCNNKLDRK